VRILHIITPKRLSGGELTCLQICEELTARGHEVHVATKRCAPVEAALTERAIPCTVAAVGNKFNPFVPLTVARLIRETGAEVVHTHHSTASLWGSYGAWLRGVPCVAHVHAINTSIWLLSATHIIACAEAVRDHLVRQGRPADRITVVCNAVETDNLPEVDPAAVRLALGLPPDGLLVTVAAHLSRKKGHAVLLEALVMLRGRFPTVQCVLMGEGRELTGLRELAERLRLAEAVQFAGYRHDAKQIMAASDVVALPSLVGEGLPLSLLEAAARGRPIVATGLAGVPELVIDGETGFTVAPGDANGLAHRLGQLLGDAALRARMGAAARELVIRRFARAGRAEAIEQVYEKALAAKRGR
jgi:glycosyltransferase involved in cell wall biosynthesis